MYRRILLAYDGTLEGRVALREGALLAKRCGAQVFLLAVTPLLKVPDGWGGFTIQPDAYQEILSEGLAKARELGLKITGALVHGDPAEEISTCAKKNAADLVVVGSRRRSVLERWWSGPSQAFLIDKLECSLLIARHAISDDAIAAELQKLDPSKADAPD